MSDSKEVPMDVGDDHFVMDDSSTNKSSEKPTDSKISETKVNKDAKVQNSKSPRPTKKARSTQDQETESESALAEPKSDDTNSIQEETKPESEEANVASSFQVEKAKSGGPEPISDVTKSIQGEEQSDSAKTDPKEASASKTSGKLSTSDQNQVEGTS